MILRAKPVAVAAMLLALPTLNGCMAPMPPVSVTRFHNASIAPPHAPGSFAIFDGAPGAAATLDASFSGAVARELQTHITQNQPKMLALNKQVMLSVDTNLDKPESRRVTFYTGRNNIFYLELAMDRTEFIKMNDFEASEAPDPDELLAQVNTPSGAGSVVPESTEHDDLLKSLGM